MTCETRGSDKQANRPSLMNVRFINTNRKMIPLIFKREKITHLQMQIQTKSPKCRYFSLPTYVPDKFSRFEGHNMLKPFAAIAMNKSSICGCQTPSFKSFCRGNSQPNTIKATVWKWKGTDTKLNLAWRWSKRCPYRLSQPHFGLSVKVKPTLPKVGSWSPPGLLKT